MPFLQLIGKSVPYERKLDQNQTKVYWLQCISLQWECYILKFIILRTM